MYQLGFYSRLFRGFPNNRNDEGVMRYTQSYFRDSANHRNGSMRFSQSYFRCSVDKQASRRLLMLRDRIAQDYIDRGYDVTIID